ncbi:MAG: hypothetical protein RLZZ623_682, partial [Actinomycetota bacterium]
MSTSRVPAVRLGDGQTRITVAIAGATWLGAWFVGNLAGAAMMTLLGRDSNDSQVSVAATVAAALALWIPILIALGLVSVRFGLSSWRADYGLAFRSIDLVGVPVGVLTQLVLLRIVYWPLQAIWPDTFSAPHLEETARDLYDSAHGAWLVALVLLVVV